jgi:hypothetical protein
MTSKRSLTPAILVVLPLTKSRNCSIVLHLEFEVELLNMAEIEKHESSGRCCSNLVIYDEVWRIFV